MVISRHSLKRAPTHKKAIMTCSHNGLLFTKPAAILLNAPCKVSFDFDKMICFYDEDDGFEVRSNVNGWTIFSKMLTRFIGEKFNNKKSKFIISPTIENNIFRLEMLELNKN